MAGDGLQIRYLSAFLMYCRRFAFHAALRRLARQYGIHLRFPLLSLMTAFVGVVFVTTP